MLMIRLQRVGKKNQPYFRVVLIEKHRKVKGKYQEVLGSHDPRKKTTSLDAERISYWLSKGVGVSATAHNLFVTHQVISGPKVKAWQPKKKEKKAEETKPEEKPAEAKTAAAAT